MMDYKMDYIWWSTHGVLCKVDYMVEFTVDYAVDYT